MEAEAGDHKKLVETFCAITSSTTEEALFFLESHNFDIDSAVSTFYENNTIDPSDLSHLPQQHNPQSPSSPSSPSYSPSLDQSPSPAPSPLLSSDPRSTISMASRDKKPSKPSGSRTGGIRTLADLNRHSDHGSDSDSDGPQEFYTGGEKSGMLVQGPPKAPAKVNEVESIFDQARQLGARDGPAGQDHSSSSSRSFAGTGRLLSGESVPSAASTPQPPQSVIHNIIFWNNGFTVNGGPLRSLQDPENQPFLESIKRSECPQELEPADRSTQIKVNLIRREEDYTEPEKVHVPFQGRGRTLGSSSSTETPAAAPALSNASPSVGLVVDPALPSTSIQLRLADGTRMVARFNNHHTVGNIRAFIDASRPGSPRTYNLQTVGFPPKQLTDVSQTVEQAGLANSVVIQKL